MNFLSRQVKFLSQSSIGSRIFAPKMAKFCENQCYLFNIYFTSRKGWERFAREGLAFFPAQKMSVYLIIISSRNIWFPSTLDEWAPASYIDK